MIISKIVQIISEVVPSILFSVKGSFIMVITKNFELEFTSGQLEFTSG
jgi:hypothetical protein